MADVNHEGIPGTHAGPSHTFPEYRWGPSTTVRTVDARAAGRAVRLVIALSIGAAVLAGVGSSVVDRASDEVSKAIDSSKTPASPDPLVPGVPATPPTPASEPGSAPARPVKPAVGLNRGSLLLRENFRTAMRRLRTGGYGRLTNLRVAPDRIDATMLTKGGRLRQIQVQPGGSIREFGISSSGSAFRNVQTLSIADINTAAPSRLTKSAAGRLKQPASKINYLVYSLSFGPDARWYAFFKGGQTFSADARGKINRRIG